MNQSYSIRVYILLTIGLFDMWAVDSHIVKPLTLFGDTFSTLKVPVS